MEYRSKQYAESVIDEYDLDLEDATWDIEVSGRLTRCHGNIRGNLNTNEYTIKLSRKAFDNFDWDHMKGVIRHELAHLVTYLEHGSHSEGDFRFQENVRMLDAPKSTDQPASEPKYIVHCKSCGHKYKRFQKSKVVKNPHRYSCGKCGENLSRLK